MVNIWPYLLILFIVSLVGCSIGFKKYVYFLSVGYGFSVILCGIAIFLTCFCKGLNSEAPVWVIAIQCALFVLYGARLSGFLLYREIKNAAYRKVLADATKTGKDSDKLPIFVMVFMWIFVSALYVAQTGAVFFRVFNGATDWILPVIGAAISLAGLIIETLADLQKSAQKKVNPKMVATKGLYKISRCPNYWGEITFWTGVFVGGISCYNGWLQWVIAIFAYIAICYIMFNGAQRLEKRQEKSYGTNPEYRAYADHTPVLLPLIPIYHVAKLDKEAEKAPAENK